MSTKAKIIIFVVAFCAMALHPIMIGMARGYDTVEVSLDTPLINSLDEKKCIEDTEYMKSSHMQLLDQWRWDVVRNGDTVYVAKDGTEYDKSLDDTCMACHSNKAEFCDTCHASQGVEPYCWDCHDTFNLWLEDEENQQIWHFLTEEGGL